MVQPLYVAISKQFTELSFCVECIKANRSYWAGQTADEPVIPKVGEKELRQLVKRKAEKEKLVKVPIKANVNIEFNPPKEMKGSESSSSVNLLPHIHPKRTLRFKSA